MTIQPECINCIASQARRVCEAIGADAPLTHTITTTIDNALQHADFTLSPPVIAAPLYEKMAQLAGKIDLYDAQKAHATQQARHYLPFCDTAISHSDDPFVAILKTAVVGNVIDLAAEVHFDLHEAITSVYHTPFAHDDTDRLKTRLSQATTLVYIGDNTGEHLFDKLAIQHLTTRFPQLKITYMVRGHFIINDVTMGEAREAQIETVCDVMDSGVPTPGFVYNLATPQAQHLFDTAEVIIAKGMGNYECMTPVMRQDICFLLKVKCAVVSRSLGQEIGAIICKMDT